MKNNPKATAKLSDFAKLPKARIPKMPAKKSAMPMKKMPAKKAC